MNYFHRDTLYVHVQIRVSYTCALLLSYYIFYYTRNTLHGHNTISSRKPIYFPRDKSYSEDCTFYSQSHKKKKHI